MSEIEVQTIAVSETPFGIFDFGMDMSEDLTVDKTNTELPLTALIRPIVAKEDQQNEYTEDIIKTINNMVFIH